MREIGINTYAIGMEELEHSLWGMHEGMRVNEKGIRKTRWSLGPFRRLSRLQMLKLLLQCTFILQSIVPSS